MISDTAALARAFFALVSRSQADAILSGPQVATPYGITPQWPGPQGGPHIDCDYWLRNINRLGRIRLVHAVWGLSRFGMSQSQLVDAISDGCLKIAMTTVRTGSPGRVPMRIAGDASPTPQGSQWLALAGIAGMFGLFYWGLRAESPEEKLAYEQMKARKLSSSYAR